MEIKNKRVLVTGADGFIGSHLVEALLQENVQIRALSLYNSFSNWGWLESVSGLDQVEVCTGDIRDVSTCKWITKDIDIIFHLAALVAIPYSYRAPDAYIETNIKGTANLCQSAIENHCEHFLLTSTSEVYGTASYIPMDEKHPLNPQSPYSASKIGADSIALSFYYSFGLPLTIVRPFNTYGPRQSARAIIPTIITQIAAGKNTIELGNLKPTRDFTYVKDTCNAFIALAKREKPIGDVVNIGTHTEISIGNLFQMIASLMNRDVKVVEASVRHRPFHSEVSRLCCNPEKLKRLTGCYPNTPLEEGLKKTIEWLINPINLIKYKAELYHV
ncbi:MAG: SDR family NAD(P)-dependent oxidoreductase [Parachlamydiaceae bacterium]